MKTDLKNSLLLIVLLQLCLPSKADNTNKVTVGLRTIDSTVVVAEN